VKKFRFLISSGPTREPLDPVRYLSNYSTGTMGRCLNEAARRRGHRVTWVRCPEDAETARDLEKKLKSLLPGHDALLMAAAVADMRPAGFSKHKIKKNDLKNIRLVKNPDVLAALSKKKTRQQVFIGFALETRDMFDNAMKKLKAKKLEAIVLQKVTEEEKPFGDRKIGAFVLEARGGFSGFKAISKRRLAQFLVRKTERFLLAKH
jgi:phosphopantothenoylcysteine decarboxylase/phosphopantothenate--cysteine ligase